MSNNRRSYGLLGIFDDVSALVRAMKSVKASHLEIHTVFSPTPHDEIGEALEPKASPVRYFAMVGGVIGGIIGYGLAAFTSLQWKLDVSGKPILAWVPFSVEGYEITVIVAVLFTFLGMLIACRIPRFRMPRFYDRRFTEDHYGLLVLCSEEDKDAAAAMLEGGGAREIHEIW
jgi:hypothetical protein